MPIRGMSRRVCSRNGEVINPLERTALHSERGRLACCRPATRQPIPNSSRGPAVIVQLCPEAKFTSLLKIHQRNQPLSELPPLPKALR
jgi:hypothetical protein